MCLVQIELGEQVLVVLEVQVFQFFQNIPPARRILIDKVQSGIWQGWEWYFSGICSLSMSIIPSSCKMTSLRLNLLNFAGHIFIIINRNLQLNLASEVFHQLHIVSEIHHVIVNAVILEKDRSTGFLLK